MINKNIGIKLNITDFTNRKSGIKWKLRINQ